MGINAVRACAVSPIIINKESHLSAYVGEIQCLTSKHELRV